MPTTGGQSRADHQQRLVVLDQQDWLVPFVTDGQGQEKMAAFDTEEDQRFPINHERDQHLIAVDDRGTEFVVADDGSTA